MSQTNILLEAGTNELEVMEFYVEEDGYCGHYGINVAKVVEIIRPQKVTAMPQMPHPCVLGAFAHRNGEVIPLIDVAKYLNFKQTPDQDYKIIITKFNTLTTAFLVSGVNRIYRLSWANVEAPGNLLTQVSRNAVTGVVRMDDRIILLLDLEAIVAEIHPAIAMRMDSAVVPEAPVDRKYRVLHADDSSSIRRLVLDLLSQEGRFEVTQAENGEIAWNILLTYAQMSQESGKPITHYVEGIITDIEMPSIDGLALCKMVKEHPILKEVPVAVFSSMVSDSLVKKCQSVGADAQFSKPDLQGLSNILFNLIKS